MHIYTQIKDRQQKEVNIFLNRFAFFAFSEEQFKQGMKKLGLQPGQESALVNMGNGGCFVLKDHAADLIRLLKKIDEERRSAMSDPETGYAFMKDMFTYELANHEYSFTGNTWETLDALGITEKDLNSIPKIREALEQAKREVIGDTES